MVGLVVAKEVCTFNFLGMGLTASALAKEREKKKKKYLYIHIFYKEVGCSNYIILEVVPLMYMQPHSFRFKFEFVECKKCFKMVN